jgi:hypothetical protein
VPGGWSWSDECGDEEEQISVEERYIKFRDDDKPYCLFSLTLLDLVTFILGLFSESYIEGLYHKKNLQMPLSDVLLHNATKMNTVKIFDVLILP